MKETIAILILALPLACRAPADPPSPSAAPRPRLSTEGERALDVVLAAERFTDDAIYDDGVTPPEVEAMRVLFGERAAPAAFAHVLANGTLPGKLFALCGIWYTDPGGFERAAAPYRHLEVEIPIQMGCTGGAMPVREIVEWRRSAAVRLASRDDTNKAWLERAAVSAHYDIVGGGYPCLFKTGGGW